MKKRFNIISIFKWFYPGLKIKRWLFLCGWGIFVVVIGSWKFGSEKIKNILPLKILAITTISLGIILLIIGIKELIVSLIRIFMPHKDKGLVDIVYKQRLLERGPRVVVIGGGSGLSTLLRGLKEYTSNITAIVTVADSGGSTGRLRQAFDIQAPGDIRHCLTALADTESLMSDLFEFRFDKTSELGGHSFGNLFITAMTKLTGDFEQAIKQSSKVLAVRGQVLPSTLSKVGLIAEYEDGGLVEGEADIPQENRKIDKVHLRSLDIENPAIIPCEEAVKAIAQAQAIILGPGSLYTSIIPNILVKEIRESILASKAPKIYICNVMTQYGETEGYSVSDHLKAIAKHSHPAIIDYCVMSISAVPKELLERYEKEKSFPVKIDEDNIRKMGYRIVKGDLISTADYVRHNPERLARHVMRLVSRV